MSQQTALSPEDTTDCEARGETRDFSEGNSLFCRLTGEFDARQGVIANRHHHGAGILIGDDRDLFVGILITVEFDSVQRDGTIRHVTQTERGVLVGIEWLNSGPANLPA